jgi:hypothetical protein
MKAEWAASAVLRIASFLAPPDQRDAWIEEWRSELWYVPRRRAMRFSLGAFRDALWLRRNSSEAERLSPAKRTKIHLESPISCVALLTALAALSIFVAVRLPAPRTMTPFAHLRARDLPGGCGVMLMYFCLLLPTTVAMSRAPANRPSMPWPSRLRRGTFLALKIALVQPMMLCGFIVECSLPPLTVAFGAACILAIRWVITDQQQRCPVCLRLLTNPVRIGTPSQTFLEWHGAESTCPHGHGLLHVSENSLSYSGKPQWLCLDDSWSGLFSEAEGRQL